MADYPALPLWTDAYLSDTDHLTFTEHGVYMRLLMLIWRTPGCRIPNDVTWICRRLRCSDEEYQSLVRPVIEEFCLSTGNYVSQKRLTKQRKWLEDKSEQQRARAKSRWDNEKNGCPADAGQHRSGNASKSKSKSISKSQEEDIDYDEIERGFVQ
jgi:uncharacterized protein YdaU (DUF1376 family)